MSARRRRETDILLFIRDIILIGIQYLRIYYNTGRNVLLLSYRPAEFRSYCRRPESEKIDKKKKKRSSPFPSSPRPVLRRQLNIERVSRGVFRSVVLFSNCFSDRITKKNTTE